MDVVAKRNTILPGIELRLSSSQTSPYSDRAVPASNFKVATYKTISLPVVLYGDET
jgi:hypothetical protein